MGIVLPFLPGVVPNQATGVRSQQSLLPCPLQELRHTPGMRRPRSTLLLIIWSCWDILLSYGQAQCM